MGYGLNCASTACQILSDRGACVFSSTCVCVVQGLLNHMAQFRRNSLNGSKDDLILLPYDRPLVLMMTINDFDFHR